MASILKGAPVVAAMNERNAALCEQLKTKGVVPTLAVVRVGAREDDLSYERGVMTRCGKVGVEVKQYLLPADAAQDDLLKVIAACVPHWLRKKTSTASPMVPWPVCSPTPIWVMLPAPRRPAWRF